jgi:uncharacterized membrane protein YfcA
MVVIGILPVHVLMMIFSGLMLFVSARMALQASNSSQTKDENKCLTKRCVINDETGHFRWNTRCFASLSTLGELSGLFSGMLGVGGGFLIVPGVRYLSDLKISGECNIIGRHFNHHGNFSLTGQNALTHHHCPTMYKNVMN